MIIAIRISSLVGVPYDTKDTLFRLRLRRKYTAILLKSSAENLNLLRKLRDYVAYGEISKEMLLELIAKRAKTIGNKKEKIDAKKIMENLDKKNLESQGIKPFFRLHPPRGGIMAKKHFGVSKGILGDNKDKINDLVRRML